MTTHWEEQQHHPTTLSAHARRLVRTSLATAALMAGLAIGLAANANADNDDEFWECVSKHPGPTDATVCCIFYDQPCGVPIDVPFAVGSRPQLTTAAPGQTGPTKKPGLTPITRLPESLVG
jgi:hypothetical protein